MEKEVTLVLPDPEAILHPIATLTAKPVTFTLDMELMRRLHNRDLSGQVSCSVLKEYILGYALRKY